MLLAHSCFILLFIPVITGERESPNKTVPPCPAGWEKMEDRCYLWPHTTWMTWADAEQFCNEKDGHLASVTNLKIHEYIVSKVVKHDHHSFFWVGGTDKGHGSEWKWTDGSDWDFEKWATYPTQQPNNYLVQDCLQIYDFNAARDGWNDNDCREKQGFVCSQRICTTADSETSTGGNKITLETNNETNKLVWLN